MQLANVEPRGIVMHSVLFYYSVELPVCLTGDHHTVRTMHAFGLAYLILKLRS